MDSLDATLYKLCYNVYIRLMGKVEVKIKSNATQEGQGGANIVFDINMLIKFLKNSLLDGARDDLYRLSLLKRTVKSAYKANDFISADLFLSRSESVEDAGWDAVVAGLSDYIAKRIYKTKKPHWSKNIRYQKDEIFNPLERYFVNEFETDVPEEFIDHNVAIPEGSLKCLMN